jgi:Xaa-Pro dipeptidase
MLNIPAIQQALSDFHFDGWLLYDFRGSNVLARRILKIAPDAHATRRYAYFVPQVGEPKKLVHRIEPGTLDHLPGEKITYLKWEEFEAGVAALVSGSPRVAMEYSARNAIPYVSRVDAGTIELVRASGSEVVCSGDLVQLFEATWDDDVWAMHREAERHTVSAYERVWKFIAENVRAGTTIRETDVQTLIMRHFAEHGLTTDHAPIVGVGPHSGDPHYAPQPGKDAEIRAGDFVLVDLWAKLDRPGGVYSDLTRTGFVGETVPEKYEAIFQIVRQARDAAIRCVEEAYAAGRRLHGWEVDQAARNVIEGAEYGQAFVHRTGHSIGQETHGNGANMDNLETHEERLVLPRTCFSIEPGIYLPEFGVRSEVNVFIDGQKKVHVTGGPLQTTVVPILASY